MFGIKKLKLVLIISGLFFSLGLLPPTAVAAQTGGGVGELEINDPQAQGGHKECGSGTASYKPFIDIGCRGEGNPILDMTFAFIRFLSVGVGLVLIGSTIVAGIQYTASRGDVAATVKAVERVRNTVIALLLYIFAYALLNWLVPGGVFY